MSSVSSRRQPALFRRFAVVGTTTMLSMVMAAQAYAWTDMRTPTAAPAAAPTAAPTAAPATAPVAAAPDGAPTAVPAVAPAAAPEPVEAAVTAVPAVSAVDAGTLAEAAAGTAHGLACSTLDVQPLCIHEHTTAQSTGSTTTAPEVGVSCAGDGRSGNRIQVLYVRSADQPDRFGSVLPTLRKQVNVANGVFARSSNNSRHLRAVTDAGCNLAVGHVTLPAAQARSFTETTKALRAAGHNRVDRKYLLFVDNNASCGLSELFLDDRAATANRNNNGNTFAAVYTPCWNGVLVAHEITHFLGGVQPSAPRSTGNHGHCTDQHEVMCYRDGSGKAMTSRCATSHATLLDCGRDDYFSTAPAAGSYLATHWNTANNSFLIGGGPATAVAPSAPTAVASTRSGESVRLTWGTPEQARSGLTAFDVIDLAASKQVLTTVSGTARAASVTLTPWRTYRLAVVARNTAGSSAPAGDHQHMVGRAPAAPSHVTPVYAVNTADVQTRLTWVAPQHATSYLIFRDGRHVATSTASDWTDPSRLALGQRYTYTVQARNAWGTSGHSPAATSTGV